MKKTLSLELPLLLLALLPVAYQAYVYPGLPETVALHYGASGQPDAYGPKSSLWLPVSILAVTTLLVGLLLKYLPRFDPKGNLAQSAKLLSNLRLIFTLFMAAVGCFVVHSSLKNSADQLLSFMPFAVLLLMALLGNSMISLKPNYFAGIRTPWTLESEVVWRKTHQFGGRLLFWGNLLAIVPLIWVPPLVRLLVAISLTVVLTLIPVVYSYRIYRQETSNQ